MRQYCPLCGHVDESGDQYPFAAEHGLGLCVLETERPAKTERHPWYRLTGEAGLK